MPTFRFNCHLCPYSTNELTHFKTHAVVHDPRREFACDVVLLATHVLTVINGLHQESHYQSIRCGITKNFLPLDSTAVIAHILQITIPILKNMLLYIIWTGIIIFFITGYFGRLVCTACGKVFTTGSTLSRHRIWHHKSEDDKFKFNCKLCPYASNISPFSRLTCINCGKIFSAAATLSRHQIWHHKCPDDIFKYNCSLCPYATNHTNRFKSHKLVHDPGRKYICKECGNGFTNSQSLKCHELIHTGEFNLDTMKSIV
ncbi:hypothetical protein TNCT_179301 [Trichonephila clavata]|uniref:C2H2-type domain-containing protein n=1 Tax=Trichonephila clavata TaxID=2740835 RepID=A0A8X6HCS3_TRICU|nr:hypothetical protein TNCT_179301 [Trichonephila clavata]